MSQIKFGCQTYSWQMSFDKFSGKIPHIADTIKEAGFAGMEAEICMLGETYFSNPNLLKETLLERGLEFPVLTLPGHWIFAKETEEEYALAQRAIAFLKDFPGSKLMLAHYPLAKREDVRERQQNHISCLLEITKRANDKGIETSFHPNSPEGSLFRTPEDYDILFDRIWNTPLGYTPDAGHIAHSDMDPMEVFKLYHEKINHVHYKDMAENGDWKSMGEGCIDFKGLTDYLRSISYDGWVMVEEESKEAVLDPDKVTIANGKYMLEEL